MPLLMHAAPCNSFVPCHTCDFVARLWHATVTRDKVAACDFIVARCDFDAACDKQTWLQVCLSHAASKSQRATMKSHAATLSCVRVAPQSRATKSQVWHRTYRSERSYDASQQQNAWRRTPRYLAPYMRDAWEHYAEEQILAAAVFVFLIEASNWNE